MSIPKLKIVSALKGMKATTLKELILALEKFKNEVSRVLLEKKEKEIVEAAIDGVTGIAKFSLDTFIAIVKQVLFQNFLS